MYLYGPTYDEEHTNNYVIIKQKKMTLDDSRREYEYYAAL